MSIPTAAIEAAAWALRRAAINDQVTAFPIGFHERHALAALSAAAAFIEAAALRDAADAAFKDKKIQGLQRVLIGNWLCARAATIEGETK